MKISVLIPMHNAENYISDTIRCALNQTWADKEIIVVDDGSSDNSLNIAKSFESEIVKVVSQKKKGAAAARNLAFQLSTGDYIQYLDADDLISTDKLEQQMNLASIYGYDPELLFTCPTKFFTTDIDHSEEINQPTDRSYDAPYELLKDLFSHNSFISSHAYLTPRNLIDQSRGWDESLSANDDGEFFARIISRSKKIIHTRESAVFYRKTPDSLSKQKSQKHAISEFRSLRKICGIILEQNNTDISRSACSNIINWFIVEWFPENKPVLREVEKTMEGMGLTFFSASNNQIFHLVKKYAGWRRAILLSEFIAEVKRKF